MNQVALSRDGTPIQAELLVDGPFSAGTFFWRARRGELRCSILAKTTYALLPRRCPIVEPPDALRSADVPWDGALEKSVRTPSDLVPFKHSPEVLVVGHAYAPNRRPQKRLAARLVVGDLDAALEVFPPRRFNPEGVLEDPAATRMPLAYEYAAGGSDSDNPVGIDMGLVDAWGRRAAPSVVPLGAHLAHPSDSIETAGWGPIAASWPSRARRLRAEDRAWLADPARLPMPTSFDVRFFQSAPSEHWLSGPIRPDERLVLENLTPAHERLVTNLDGVVPYASMLGSKELKVPLIADTLFIDTDRAVVTLTWRGLVLVDERAPRLTVAIARSSSRGSMPPAAPNVRRGSMPPAAPDEGRATLLTEIETTHVETPDGGVAAALLPFSVPEPNARATVPDYDDDALPFRTPDADLATTKARPALRLTPVPPEPSRMGFRATPAPPSATPSPPPSVPPARPSFASSPSPPPAPPPRPSFASSPAPPPSLASFPGLGSSPDLDTVRADVSAWAPPVEPARDRELATVRTDARPWAAHVTPAAEPPRGTETRPSREGAARPSAGGWMSLRAASDAAAEKAGGAVKGEDRKTERDRFGSPLDTGSAQRRFALVDLLAHDAALPQRLRRAPAFAKVLAAAADRPAWVRPEEPHEERQQADRDRLDVLRVLSFTAPSDLPRVREIVEETFDDATALELPLVVVSGQLKPTHDEIALLRATVQAGQPLSSTNKQLQAALTVLQEAIDGGVAPPGEATAALLRQAEQAAGSLWSYLFAQVQRSVLEERQFKRRTVLGEARIRADLTTPSGETVPAYVPAAVASKLPMLPSFQVVVLGELRPREDAQETHAEAFLVWALGRVVRQAAGRGK